MTPIETRLVWDVAAKLGEGPIWDRRDGALWFVDIKSRKIHRFDPVNQARGSWDAPEQVGFIVPAKTGGFVVGLKSGLFSFDAGDGAFAPIAAVDADLPNNRLNDGVVDPSGRLWFGTMDDGERVTTGAFYRFAHGQVERTTIAGIAITNGPAVSPDGRWLYVVDTLGGTIERAEIGDSGGLGPRQPFVAIARGDGSPDGPTIDSEGCLWIALYGGWQARRYSPDGELLARVQFPVANITKLAFGGDDLRTVYATTARQNLDQAELERQPLAGALFEFRADVPGLACPEVIL